MNASQKRKSNNGVGRDKLARNWLVPILLWGAPFVVAAIVAPLLLLQETSSISPVVPRYSFVGSRLEDFKTSVQAHVSFGPPAQVRSASDGLVTSVAIEPGAVVKSGDLLLTVNGSPVVAVTTEAPFYRDIGPGVSGADVEMMNQYFGVGSEPTYTKATKTAVVAFQSAIGVKADGIFHLANVAFVPASSSHVVSVDAQLDSSISAGAPIYTSDRPTTSVSLSNADPSQGLSEFGSSAVVLSSGTHTIQLASVEIKPSEIPDISKLISDGEAVSALTLQNQSDSGADVQGLLLTLATPKHVGAVPGSALYVSNSDRACVFVLRHGSLIPTTVSVDSAMSTEIGVAFVPARLAGQKVLTDGSSAADSVRRACSS